MGLMMLTATAPVNGKATRGKRMKLPDAIQVDRLAQAAYESRQALEPFRRFRLECARQQAGEYYTEEAARVPVPVNNIARYVDIIGRAIISKNPRLMLSTSEEGQERAVAVMQDWLNETIVEQNVAETYQRAVTDSLYCMGIVKIAIQSPADAALAGWATESGEPCMMDIDLDDYVCDMQARRWEFMEYEDHRVRMPVDVANEMLRMPRKQKLEANDRDSYEGGNERIISIGRGASRREELEDHVDLHEVYFPRHRLVAIFEDDGGRIASKEPLKVMPWIGPQTGPFYKLGQGVVPGNLIPKAPLLDLYYPALAINRGTRKLVDEMDRYKAVLPIRGGQMDEAGLVKQARDGEIIQADNADTMKEVTFGGPSQAVFLMTKHLQSVFGSLAGNLDLIAGLGPQSRTAAQDKMLNENAGAGIASMVGNTTKFITDTMRAMLWFYWNHPTKEMSSRYEVQGLPDLYVNRRIGPSDRRGPMPKLRLDPYTLTEQTPQQRLAFINATLQQLAPLVPVFAQQGKVPDAEAIISVYAKYGDEPELSKIFRSVEPPPDASGRGGDGGGMGMPANTSREYIRRSEGADSQQAQAADTAAGMEGMMNESGTE